VKIRKKLILIKSGNIGTCLSRLSKEYYYLDFYFSYSEDGGINLDIFPGREKLEWTEFLHPRLAYETVFNYTEEDIKRIYKYKQVRQRVHH
jgi:hypothetical protein